MNHIIEQNYKSNFLKYSIAAMMMYRCTYIQFLIFHPSASTQSYETEYTLVAENRYIVGSILF